jgi:hypothetical protein
MRQLWLLNYWEGAGIPHLHQSLIIVNAFLYMDVRNPSALCEQATIGEVSTTYVGVSAVAGIQE